MTTTTKAEVRVNMPEDGTCEDCGGDLLKSEPARIVTTPTDSYYIHPLSSDCVIDHEYGGESG